MKAYILFSYANSILWTLFYILNPQRLKEVPRMIWNELTYYQA